MNDEICFLRPLISCLGLLRRPPNSYIVSGSGSAEAALSSHIEFSQVRKFLVAIYGSRPSRHRCNSAHHQCQLFT